MLSEITHFCALELKLELVGDEFGICFSLGVLETAQLKNRLKTRRNLSACTAQRTGRRLWYVAYRRFAATETIWGE